MVLTLDLEIRRAVLEGKIDQALKCTSAYYPQVLKDNEQVYFNLRCRKFTEMIRRDAEEKIRLESNPGLEGKGSTARAGLYQAEDAEMEGVDDTGEWTEHMDTDNGDRAETAPVGKLLDEALTYGQELCVEFDGDQHREKQLKQIFALIAYPNPLKVKEVSHMLDRAGRVTVAEELNSAILRKFLQHAYTTPPRAIPFIIKTPPRQRRAGGLRDQLLTVIAISQTLSANLPAQAWRRSTHRTMSYSKTSDRMALTARSSRYKSSSTESRSPSCCHDLTAILVLCTHLLQSIFACRPPPLPHITTI